MTPLPAGGLYAITPAGTIDTAALLAQVSASLRGGARMIQYRAKAGAQRMQAEALLQLCRQHGAPLIINDDVALAATIGADGAHLGRDDLPLAQARALLGAAAIIGVSCYNEPDRARAAALAGADYVAFGSFYPSTTKPRAVRAGLPLLRQARDELDLPIVAIGGITPDNGRALIEAGAHWLAAIDGVFAAADIEQAARRYARLFEP